MTTDIWEDAHTYWLIFSISHCLPCRLQSACLQLTFTHCIGWYLLAGWSCKDVALFKQDISKVVSEICMTEFVLTSRPAMLLCFRRVCRPRISQSVHPWCWLYWNVVIMWHTLVLKGWSWCHDEETVHLKLCLLLIKWGKLSSSYSTSVVCLYCTCLLWFAAPFYQVTTVPSCCFSSPSQPYLFHFVQPVSAFVLQGYKPKFGWNKHLICSASLFLVAQRLYSVCSVRLLVEVRTSRTHSRFLKCDFEWDMQCFVFPPLHRRVQSYFCQKVCDPSPD